MSDPTPQDALPDGLLEASQHPPAADPPVGDALRLAREAVGMTIEAAAARLRLSPRQVQALETDDRAVLPDATFLRGFLRNYARLLHIDPQPLLESYPSLTPGSSQPSITLASVNIAFAKQSARPWLPFVLGGALLLLALLWLAYHNFQLPLPPPAPPPARNAATATPLAPAAPAVGAQELPIPQALDQPPPADAIAQPLAAVPESVIAPVAAPPATPPATPAGATLKLSFSALTWVRVTDGNGKEIFSRSGTAGSEEVLAVTPPAKVVVGNVNGVKLTFRDAPVELADYAKANVARLTLE